jgi:hypothetical protein
MKKQLSEILTKKITRQRMDEFLKAHQTKAKVLDIGSRRAPYHKYYPNATTVDIDPACKPDVVADAHDMNMFKKGEFEVVLATEVLEHLYNPFVGITEMARVLEKGGKLVLTTRFIFPLHDTPHDYFRFTKYGLQKLLEPHFTDIQIQEETTTLETLAVLYQRLGFQTATFHFNFFRVVWHLLARMSACFRYIPSKEWGSIRCDKREKNILTSGYFVTAIRKKS